MSSPKIFRSLAQASPPELSELMQRARRLQLVAQRVRELLPDPLARQCQPGNIVNDTLFVYVTSPVWATRLRYLAPALVKNLQQQPDTRQIGRIRIVVQPDAVIQRRESAAAPLRMSRGNADLLRHAAAAAPTARLSAALRRLAQRGLD